MKTGWTIAFLFFVNSLIFSQLSIDTTIVLEAATVSEARTNAFGTGFKTQTFRPEKRAWSGDLHLGEMLARHSPVFIKNYGPSGLSTAAFRGSSAGQTAVLWEGFDIRQATVGLTDFSAIPGFLFDRVMVQYGGSGALWGSGAVGGSIHLANDLVAGPDRRVGLAGGAGAFGTFSAGGKWTLAGEKTASAGKLFYRRSANDFTFTAPNGDRKKLPHAAIQTAGWLHDLTFRSRPGVQWSWHIWAQKTDREIPPTTFQNQNFAEQKERSLRQVWKWQKTGKKSATGLRAGLFFEDFHYDDDTLGIHSQNRVLTAVAEYENRLYFADNQKLTWSAQYRFVGAESSGFDDMPTRQTAAFFVAWNRPSKNGKSALTLSARQAFSGQNRRPFTPAAGWTWMPAPAWVFRAHIARSFRLPSLNDLFWTPGGNPELRPEAGWSEEIGLTFRPFKKDGAPAFSTTFFNRLIKNQIIWLPGASGIWSPGNIGQVWSRGVENEVKGRVPAGGFFLDFSLRHDLVFSTNQTARFDQDATFGKQLIYVPNNRFSAYIKLKMKWLDIFLSQNYTSKVYTLADNSEALPGWARTDAGLGMSFNKIPARLYFSVQNIWNKSYEVVRTYPMPGRHAALRFAIDFSKD